MENEKILAKREGNKVFSFLDEAEFGLLTIFKKIYLEIIKFQSIYLTVTVTLDQFVQA